MSFAFNFFAVVVAVCGVSLSTWAESASSATNYGKEKSARYISSIEVRNLQGERLARVRAVAVDISNGRIVEVLVVSGDFLGFGGKVVAVPPLALSDDPTGSFYVLNVSSAVFKSAPEVNRSNWDDFDRGSRIAAAYHFFGQEPYFLEEGQKTDWSSAHPKVSLGQVARANRILGMSVKNYENEPLGKIWGMNLDIPAGRIQTIIVSAQINRKTRVIVSPMALKFSPVGDNLLLDDSYEEFANETHYLFVRAANGNDSHAAAESYKGPDASESLEQGNSFADRDRTARINRRISRSKIDVANVRIVTMEGRVTLRGWVSTEKSKQALGEIAIATARLELVDNQITIGKPVKVEVQ